MNRPPSWRAVLLLKNFFTQLLLREGRPLTAQLKKGGKYSFLILNGKRIETNTGRGNGCDYCESAFI
jgi:hypothetical protein